MSEINIATRYATALLGLARDNNSVEETSRDFHLVYNTMKASRDLRLMLVNPVIKNFTKLSILSEVFGSRISRASMDFLNFIVGKNREELLYIIVQRFLEMLDDYSGIVAAEVTSAVELTDQQKERITVKLQEYTNKSVRLAYKTDTRLLGGFVIRIKDTVLDASLKHQLEKLKSELLNAELSLN
ncbi:MAG: ATP synthase F1 subunit delta [Bacteroidota bacterium]